MPITWRRHENALDYRHISDDNQISNRGFQLKDDCCNSRLSGISPSSWHISPALLSRAR